MTDDKREKVECPDSPNGKHFWVTMGEKYNEDMDACLHCKKVRSYE